MKFRNVYGVRIPEGEAFRIRVGGETLWTRRDLRYVSFGDSIAAGHAINAQWATEYGVKSQYGENGNTSTAIVPGSYADLLRKSFEEKHGAGTAKLTSFAHSGDTVSDLIDMLNDEPVKEAVAGASLITVCIGANDILGHVTDNALNDYISSGSLDHIASKVQTSLNALQKGKYRTLFGRLAALNKTADVVFTTIYNPYKYLWIEEGRNGFFKPILDLVPDINLFGFDVSGLIKDKLLEQDVVKLLFSRINGLDAWVETYVTMLNDILREQITAFNNPRFKLADTKAVFDPVPDRTVTGAEKHYDELVNVEYTRGYDFSKMDWGQLYGENGDAEGYWKRLAGNHVGWDGVDIAGLASEFVNDTRVKVVTPDIDPHPEAYGQYALSKSFEDVLGWSALPRHTVSYAANGGTGSMASQSIVALDNNLSMATIKHNAFGIPGEGYYFTNWASNGTTYTGGQRVGLRGDLELTAGWSDEYPVRIAADKLLIGYVGSEETGPKEYYGVFINGVRYNLDKIGDSKTIYVPYNTEIGIVACTESSRVKEKCSVKTSDGQVVYGGDNGEYMGNLRYGVLLGGKVYATTGIDIRFVWHYNAANLASWWTAEQTTFEQ